MRGEVISIGDELTSGQRLDTNSQWLSTHLADLGIQVMYHTTVGDDLQANIQVMQTAINRADLIVITGGLGPTDDDLTRQAIAEATGKELVLDEASLEHIELRFSARGRTMPEKNKIQAYFPASSQVIPNPNGTAPGIDMRVSRTDGTTSRLFALPGVPIEMKEMWQQTVHSVIQSMEGVESSVIKHYCLKCFGVGESHLEAMVPDLIKRGRKPSVGITVHQATITLRITAQGIDEQACLDQMQSTIQEIHDSLGELVYGTEEDELQDVVIKLLLEQNGSLSVHEADTGGLLSLCLTEADTAKNVFRGASILPTEDQAEQMAKQTREQFDTDYAIAIGPLYQTGIDENAEYQYAVATREKTMVESSRLAGHPEIHRPRAVKQALNLLRKVLLDSQK
ncbi:MAG: damage-inducible protein CinA [Blastopirellula sp.]|nr:MAG: damage-inducible protein CinA [Blastopirellula sp.]